jgi:hypothetical protein
LNLQKALPVFQMRGAFAISATAILCRTVFSLSKSRYRSKHGRESIISHCSGMSLKTNRTQVKTPSAKACICSHLPHPSAHQEMFMLSKFLLSTLLISCLAGCATGHDGYSKSLGLPDSTESKKE